VAARSIAAALASVHDPTMVKHEEHTLFDAPPPLPRAGCVAFDIEIANVIELAAGEDLEQYGPFDISCAAAIDGRGAVRHWVSRDRDGRPADKLDAATARDMLTWLRAQQVAGARVCAWNGLSFDVRWLGVAADDLRTARDIALDLVDPMFQLVCQRGFPVSLAAAAEGFGLAERKSMDGAQAPIEWQKGNRQQVLDYVAGDCRITASVVERIAALGELRWRTKRGGISNEPMPELLSVRKALELPLPDTSWMSTPLRREKFTAWMAAVR
jgi:hypothetical protein